MIRRRLIGLIFTIFAGSVSASAQFIGYTSPQTVAARVFNAVTCPSTTVVANLGQTQHYLTYTVTGGPQAIRLQIEGSQDGVNFFSISQESTDPLTAGLFGSGYFPVVRINCIVAISGAAPTITAFYSGSSGSSPGVLGIFNRSPQNRITLFQAATLASNPTITFATTYGNTAGYILMANTGVTSSTCVATLSVIGLSGTLQAIPTMSFALGGGNVSYPMPDFPAQTAQISTSGCAGSTGTVSAEYYFTLPTTPNGPFYKKVHIATLGSLVVTATPGVLHGVTINTRGTAANTATLIDAFTCTAPPPGFAIIDTTVSTTTFIYDVALNNGLCVITATGTAADLTIAWK